VSGDTFLFQQYNASAREAIELLECETQRLPKLSRGPPNSPDRNPVDYEL